MPPVTMLQAARAAPARTDAISASQPTEDDDHEPGNANERAGRIDHRARISGLAQRFAQPSTWLFVSPCIGKRAIKDDRWRSGFG
jgi:hypothetical protein